MSTQTKARRQLARGSVTRRPAPPVRPLVPGVDPCLECDFIGPERDTLSSWRRGLHKDIHEFWRAVRQIHHDQPGYVLAGPGRS